LPQSALRSPLCIWGHPKRSERMITQGGRG
jgi:hypothetical protein